MQDSKSELKDVLWLGGSPCTGKSSISKILATRFNIDVYHVDEAIESHAQRFDPARNPGLTTWNAATWNQRWMPPIDSLLQNVIACYEEHFRFVLEDVLSLPKDKPPG